jgi:hypothetical protein
MPKGNGNANAAATAFLFFACFFLKSKTKGFGRLFENSLKDLFWLFETLSIFFINSIESVEIT